MTGNSPRLSLTLSVSLGRIIGYSPTAAARRGHADFRVRRNAFSNEDSVTVCYEFIDEIWKNAAEKTTPAGIAPIDTLIGPWWTSSCTKPAMPCSPV
jgi:hypothetical protein